MAILIRFFLLCFTLPAFAAVEFIALSYHEVENDTTPLTSPTAVRASDLAAQFAWLKANGYQPVSVDAIVAARNGGPALPPKAVLLTFDDGLKDVYTRAYPLLKLFNYPAVIALVGTWLDVPAGQMVDYDNTPRSRELFVTWDEVREMQRSGLIEVATHAYNLHRGVLANPQGNTEPAAITRIYQSGKYESDNDYLKRIRNDLAESCKQIGQKTDKPPRILVWPYGRSNGAGQEIAQELGLSLAFTLEDGATTGQTPLIRTHRYLVENSPSLQGFAELLRRSWASDPARSVKVEPGNWQNEEAELSSTLDQLLSLQPNMAFVTPNQNGSALFQTTRRPLSSDSLNRICWQIERRAGVPVFIDLPDDWLNDSELIGDLARHVNFAGLRLTAAPGSDLAKQVLSTAERWRWPLKLIHSLQNTPTDAAWAGLRQGDLIALPATPANIAALPASAKTKVLLEFDLAQPAAQIARQMRELEARGFRQFGLAGVPDADMDEIAHDLSLRSQPQLK
jgi:peptidoglycan/xylan/chitin deacetylase (PgdA/CDA1 family)